MRYLFLLFLAVCCCGHAPKARVVVTHDRPLVALQFHGDVDFTVPERALLMQAVSDLEYQTAGLYRIGVTWDLNFPAGVERMMDRPFLIRAESSYPWIQMVEFLKNGEILGLTMRDDDGTPPRVYLVIDRLSDPTWLRHVAMHELLHAAGLDDIGPPNSIMSGAVCHAVAEGEKECNPRLCMTPADQAEFCRVEHCQTTELNGCDW